MVVLALKAGVGMDKHVKVSAVLHDPRDDSAVPAVDVSLDGELYTVHLIGDEGGPLRRNEGTKGNTARCKCWVNQKAWNAQRGLEHAEAALIKVTLADVLLHVSILAGDSKGVPLGLNCFKNKSRRAKALSMPVQLSL